MGLTSHGAPASGRISLSLTGTALLGGIAFAAPTIATSYTLFHSVVCLSVCLSSVTFVHLVSTVPTNPDGTWQVHLWIPMALCVTSQSVTPSGREDLEVKTPAKPWVLCCHVANTNERFCFFMVLVWWLMLKATRSIKPSPRLVFILRRLDKSLLSWACPLPNFFNYRNTP